MNLQNLDSVLAFSVVMLLLSLIVTIVVQGVVEASHLRGQNLLWGVQKLLGVALSTDLAAVYELHKTDGNKPLAAAIAAQQAYDATSTTATTSALAADNAHAAADAEPDATKKAALQQTATSADKTAAADQSTASDARDTWLALQAAAFADKQVQQWTGALAGQHSAAIAQAVVHHPMVTSTGDSHKATGRGAVALRQDEMLAILHDLGTNTFLATRLGLDADARTALTTSFTQAQQAAKQGLAALDQVAPAKAAEVRQLLDKADTRSKAAVTSITTWFNAMEDRMSGRFARQTQLCTIVIASVMCFALHIDALQIFKTISSRSDVRNSLVNSAGAALQISDHVDKIIQDSQVKAILGGLPQLDTAAKARLQPAKITTVGEAQQWITNTIADAQQQTVLLGAFQQAVSQTTRQSLEELSSNARQASALLTDSSLPLFPDTLTVATWCDLWGDPPSGNPFHHVLGVLIACALLGLGAPFWFNTLRTLSNLRPAIAGKIDAENAADADS